MYRLTEIDEYGNADIIALSDVMPELYAELSFSEVNALTDALNRLAAYEDAEEQGRMIILPCKVGDTVHAVINGKIVSDVVDCIEINSSCCKVSTQQHSWLCNANNIFLTRETAEAALKEMEE